MTIPHSTTYDDIRFKFRILRQFQVCFLKRPVNSGLQSLMLVQGRRVIAEIKAWVMDDPSFNKQLANKFIREYDVSIIIAECDKN